MPGSTPCSSTSKPPAESRVVRDGLILAVLAALLFVPWLGARDLWNPNEALYGRAVVEMADRGSWLVPTVNGVVFDEKPILYFWLALASSAVLGGVDELTLRLPTALAGIAAVLLLYVLVLPYTGRVQARLAGLSLMTIFVVFWSARQVQMDLLLAACTLGAVLGATRAIDRIWSPVAGWSTAGCAAGLAVLAKGPVGLIVPALAAAVYALVTGGLRELARPALLPGAAAFAVVASPWYLLLWLRGETAFLSELLLRQNLLRFVEPWDHAAAWWYYLKYFWIDMAPWAWFILLAPGLAAQGTREDRLHRLAWGWILVVVLFFSLSASKRSPYILPVAPAVAVLAAGVAERWCSGRLDRARRAVAAGLAGFLGLLLIVGGIVLLGRGPWVEPPSPEWGLAVIVEGAVACGGGVLVLAGLLAGRWRPVAPAAAAWAAVFVLYLAAAATVLPAADAFKSPRPFCDAVLARVGPDDPLRGYHEWRWRAGYSFYVDRSVPNLASPAELREYWSRPERVFLIVEEGRIDEVAGILGEIRPLATRAIGDNRAYLLANRD